MASSTIDTYLTSTTQPYYEKVMAIVANLKTAIESVKNLSTGYPFIVYTDTEKKPDIKDKIVEFYIFGGYIRNIMEHYHSKAEVFTPPNDVDMFIRFNNENVRTPSQTTWERLFVPFIIQSLASHHTISNFKIKHNTYEDYDYGLVKIVIDGIKFDITTHINDLGRHCPRFDYLSDFTINNLMVDSSGNLSTRIKLEKYHLDSCIEHIQRRQLVFINNESYYGVNEDGSICVEHMATRKAKMIAYGYTE